MLKILDEHLIMNILIILSIIPTHPLSIEASFEQVIAGAFERSQHEHAVLHLGQAVASDPQ